MSTAPLSLAMAVAVQQVRQVRQVQLEMTALMADKAVSRKPTIFGTLAAWMKVLAVQRSAQVLAQAAKAAMVAKVVLPAIMVRQVRMV